MNWTDEKVKEFAKICSLGQYGDYENCGTIDKKLERFKELNLIEKEICLEIIKTKNDIGDDRWKVYANGMFLDFFFDFISAENFFQRYKTNLLIEKKTELVLTESIKTKTSD
jgi:hypothetical protein